MPHRALTGHWGHISALNAHDSIEDTVMA